MNVVKLSIEVITLPVGDVERALRLYVDQVGFTLDVTERRVPRRAAYSARLQLLDPDRSRTHRRAPRITSQRLSRRYRPRGYAEPPS
jgi:hypothetical protein